MVNHSSLYIGIDFDQSKMQISYYNPHTKEIEPYKEQKDSESTILSIERYFTPKNTKWYHRYSVKLFPAVQQEPVSALPSLCC